MKFVAEYIWLDGSGNIRSKSRTIETSCSEQEARDGSAMKRIRDIKTYKNWNFDGSSTGDAIGSDSEIIIQPVSVYNDPFRKPPNVLVLCDCYLPNGEKTPGNTRKIAKDIFDKHLSTEPWYGLEQEFFIMKSGGIAYNGMNHSRSKESYIPYGINNSMISLENPQGQYYCSVGHQNSFGRKISEQAYHLALEANINCSGMNAEVAIGQWEIQVGPCLGIEAGDQLVILRYILQRVGEIHDVQISFHPKPVQGNWNGSGCHTNFSTKQMREAGGYDKIINAIKKLENKHMEHMEIYGKFNDLRCSGEHETANFNEFSYGVADRGSSIRIPQETEKNKCGYFEDRRPASNMDPYLVTSKILETVCE